MYKLQNFIKNYFNWVSLPEINSINIIEILILTFFVYKVIGWLKNTRAWILLKGILLLLSFYMISFFMGFHVFVWVFEKTISLLFVAVIVIFQPELRKALEDLGTKKITNIKNIFSSKRNMNERFSNKSIKDIVSALEVLSKSKTGALMLLEQDNSLVDYEKTGISLNADISKELLISIFEDKTPLHDGAIILRNNKIIAATCYLPLSKNLDVNKSLGTRHRAALGASEITDSLTLIVSEETGNISIAKSGELIHNVNKEFLWEELIKVQNKNELTKDLKRGGFFEKIKKYFYK